MPGTEAESKADLVLEGGGVKGIALVGALEVLQEHGYEFPRVAGTSAGAIVGALVAAEMPMGELVDLMRTIDYRRFRDVDWLDRLPGGKLASLLFEEGIYEGRYLVDFLDEQLEGLGKTTFDKLRLPADPNSSLPAEQRFRLVVIASDVSLKRLVRLPWDYPTRYDTDPGPVPVSAAVRASMSIPFFFEPAEITYQRTVDGQPVKTVSTLVDGGMLSNFPVDLFDRTDGQPPRWPTFGIKLSSLPDDRQMPDVPDGPLQLARSMIATLTTFHDAAHIDRPDVVDRTIFIDTFGISAVDFDIDRATQDRLYESGRQAAEKFLDGWDFDTYVADHRA